MAHILILEPDALLGSTFLAILEAVALSATRVPGVDEAVALLQERDFQLVILALPPTPESRAEMLERARAAAPDIPFLAVINQPDFAVAVETMRAGGCDCLVKPVSAETFVEAVGRALRMGTALSRYQQLLERRTRELAESERFYQSLVENLGQSILRKDLEGRFTYANQQFCQGLGCTLEEIRGRKDSDFYPEDLAKKYTEDDRRVMESRQPWTAVEEHQLAHGQRRYVHVTKIPVGGADGSPIGLQCTFRDITAKKLADGQLRKLARAVDQSPTSIVITNRSGEIEFVNPKFTEVTGYTFAEVAGKNPRILNAGNLSATHYQNLWATISAGREWRGEFYNRKKNGTCFWEAASISAVRDANGAITHFIAVKEDITERKRMQAQLAEACNGALASARAKAEFLANMSHEIRTPMNGVIGLTGLLLETELTEDQRQFAEAIRQSGDSLLTIINDILDFSKLEAQKLVLESNDFTLNESIESTLELLAERAQSKSLELTGFVDPQVPSRLRGDCGRLRQILFNLVGNAIKFTEHGEVALSVSCQQESAAHVLLRFAVRDTGIGIEAEAQSRLFQAFSQADASTTRKYGGSGLGLAICKQLVEIMGGQIGVDSQPGQGSTFWFTAQLEKAFVQPLAEAPRGSLAQLRVLIVDDNATNLQVMRHLALAWKMQPVCVSSGSEALQRLREAHADPFPMAILDMQMPQMDGVMLATAIKTDPAIASTRLVLLTSLGRTLSSAELKEAGIEACQSKPIRQSLLLRCLTSIMGTAATSSRPAIARTESFTAKLRVLVAEDNAINQKVTLGQLKKFGITADVVANGREVLNALRHAPYDVVLMDCQMPEMDGYEATLQIRQRERREASPRTRIVAVTARAMESDRAECLLVGMDDYISKPVSEADLREVLQRCLSLSAGSADASADPPIAGPDLAPTPALRSLPPPPAPLSERPPVEMQRLKEVAGDDPELLRDILQLYFSQAETILQGLAAALGENDCAQVNRLAHTLVGASATCGMVAMVEPLRALEKQGRESQLAGMAELVAEVRTRLGMVRSCLEGQIAEHGESCVAAQVQGQSVR